MQITHEDEDRGMNRRHVAGEPLWEIDVYYRAAVGAIPFCKLSERAPEAAADEDESLRSNHRAGDGDSLVGSASHTGVEDIEHARLD